MGTFLALHHMSKLSLRERVIFSFRYVQLPVETAECRVLTATSDADGQNTGLCNNGGK